MEDFGLSVLFFPLFLRPTTCISGRLTLEKVIFKIVHLSEHAYPLTFVKTLYVYIYMGVMNIVSN